MPNNEVAEKVQNNVASKDEVVAKVVNLKKYFPIYKGFLVKNTSEMLKRLMTYLLRLGVEKHSQ